MFVRGSGIGFAAGLAIGAAIGLTIGFLYAPRSGKETREQLKAKAAAMMGKCAEAFDKAKEAAAEASKTVVTKMGEAKK